MPSELLFINHNINENNANNNNNSSKANTYEAAYILNLCNCILNKGCDFRSITI